MDNLLHAFGAHQLQEFFYFFSWIGQAIFVRPMVGIYHLVGSLGIYAWLVYIPLIFFILVSIKPILRSVMDTFLWITTYQRKNKYYPFFKRLPLLVTPRLKYIGSYRGDTKVLTYNLFILSLILMTLIKLIPFPFGKFILYFLLVCIVLMYTFHVLVYGYMRPLLILSGVVFSQALLITNYHFGFTLNPHEYLLWIIPVNPTEYTIDISRMYFSWILIVSYLALFKYIANSVLYKLTHKQISSSDEGVFLRNNITAFGMLNVTELTPRELVLWDTQSEGYFKSFYIMLFIIPFNIILFFTTVIYFVATYPYIKIFKIRFLEKVLDGLNFLFNLKIKLKHNKYLAVWRFSPEMDGYTRKDTDIDMSLNNYLVDIRNQLSLEDADIKEELERIYPEFNDVKTDETLKKELNNQIPVEIVTPDTIFPKLQEFCCTDATIRMIKGKYSLDYISKAIHVAQLSDGDIIQKRNLLFQELES
jgi:hypothetical protein